MRRTVFYISDSTGITAETIGHSILAQFEGIEFDAHRLPFIDNADKAADAALRIKTVYARSGERPIVVNTMADQALCDVVADSGALMIDLFAPFMSQLERELGAKRSGAVNRSHGVVDPHRYDLRIGATNYALNHDDGVSTKLDEADVILIGVSRSGKTPTCLYLALQYGVKAANYPLTDEDLEREHLPDCLRRNKSRLFGLDIDEERLAQIRAERRPNSRYASLEQARWELTRARKLMRSENIPNINTTQLSIEEIASRIMSKLGIERATF
jgi:[pyruvate, water dikinase]-phosphate phosphotransferase / [pyruvate, water dikinase] kinase